MIKEYTLNHYSFANDSGIKRKYILTESCVYYSKNELQLLDLEESIVANLFNQLEKLEWGLLFEKTQDFMVEGASLFRVKTPSLQHLFEFYLNINYRNLFGCDDQVIKNLDSLEKVFSELKSYT